ncbi:hypothetical protein PX554_18055 [Sphingomonas sp. H39-1-10]|uniref:hypothetical protein n=1 Tax=Sphingomonas pollutisoli TaxID=3030829 RepID=UPI0023B8CE73|nr:hypothetical protein [Sphingomonas pollutisoli]MDF0490041.1 hypothetical protein [Sphingomonas pollutisoli]
MNARLQLCGLAALTLLAAALLYLIGATFAIIGHHIGPDGRVPSAEAFGLTALLLSFREVVASMRSIWDAVDRSNLTDKLAASLPSAAAIGDGPTGKPDDPVSIEVRP